MSSYAYMQEKLKPAEAKTRAYILSPLSTSLMADHAVMDYKFYRAYNEIPPASVPIIL